jgi:sugar lactone lactonase YvrE
MKKNKKHFWVLVIGLAVVAGPLGAVETSFWQTGTFDDFLQGTLTGASLSRDGELRLAPEARALFTPDENVALSLAADSHKSLYVGTGHEGKVFRVDGNNKGSLLFTAHEPDVFALAVGPDGALYVGTSPDGKIYRVTADGKSSVFYNPNTKYVWALAFDKQGRLYAGTGDQGKILRIDPEGKGTTFYDTKQTHIMCLTFDNEGSLLAGSVPNGLIYRFTPEGKAFVLYQAGLPEIHALATDARGRVYAAALGGAGGKGTSDVFVPGTQGPATPSTVTTVTVEASAGDGLTSATSPEATTTNVPSFNHLPSSGSTFTVPKIQQGRGSLIEIQPDSSAETVWTSNNESIFGLAVRGDHVLFSTDSNGRIFDLANGEEGATLTLLTETREALATRLLLEGNNLYIATTNITKLFRLGSSPSRAGTYESAVKDTKFISRWGVLSWRGDTPAGTGVELYTRSGNTDRPDQTWSEWSGPYRNRQGEAIQSPAARYLQWRAVMSSSGNTTPVLDDVTVSFRNQNLPPQIRSLNVSTGSERTNPAGLTSPAGVFSTITVSSAGSTSFGSQSSPPANVKVPITFTWQADDPNNDPLVFSLYVKAADEQEWHLVKDGLHQNSYTLDLDTLPDGKYTARLVASDQDNNPPGLARAAEMLSSPFWVNNSPPLVRLVVQTVDPKGTGLVRFEAVDRISPLRSAEISFDGQPWTDVDSDDGIIDSLRETFTTHTPKLSPGEHLVTLRVYDTAGNAGIGKAVLRVQ